MGKNNLPSYRIQNSEGKETSFSVFFSNCEIRRKGRSPQGDLSQCCEFVVLAGFFFPLHKLNEKFCLRS